MALLLLQYHSLGQPEQDLSRGPAEHFKEFLSKPPIISNLRCRLEVPSITTNEVLLRYQPDSLLLAIRTEAPANTTINPYQKVLGRTGSHYFYQYYRDLYRWTNAGVPQEMSNTLAVAYHSALRTELPRILNLGCELAPVGSVIWSGDAFRVTNTVENVRLLGTLTRDREERAAQLMVDVIPLKPALPVRFRGKLIYTYTYGGCDAPPYLPCVVALSAVPTTEQSSAAVWTLVLDQVHTSVEPLPQSTFSLTAVEAESVTTTFMISNEFLLYSEYDRVKRVLDPHSKQLADKRASVRRKYLASSLMVALALPLILWLRHGIQSRKCPG